MQMLKVEMYGNNLSHEELKCSLLHNTLFVSDTRSFPSFRTIFLRKH